MISKGNQLAKLLPKDPYRSEGDWGPLQYEYNLLKQRWGHIRAILDGKEIPPYEMEIQSSSSCNLHCEFCVGQLTHLWRNEMRLANRLNEENIDDCIDHLLSYQVSLPEYSETPFTVDTLKISGFVGEPLVDERSQNVTLTLIKQFKRAKRRVVLFTNGLRLDREEIREGVLRANEIHISLDAGSGEVFSKLKLRGQRENKHLGMYEEILDNIEELCRLRDDRFPGTRVGVGFVIHRGNYRDIYHAADDVKKRGVNFIRYKFDITAKNGLDQAERAVSDDLFEMVGSHLQDQKFAVIMTRTPEGGTMAPKSQKCYTQFLWGTIGANGNVYPCDHNTSEVCPAFGNIIVGSLEEIWKSTLRKEIQRTIPEICVFCSPFASRVNPFLDGIDRLEKSVGWAQVEAWREEILRENVGGSE